MADGKSESEGLNDLVCEARQGRVDSANRLVALFQKEIFRMIYYRVFSREDAEDLTQEVFIKMFSSFKSLKEAGKFRPWLFKITLNKVRDHKRKRLVYNLFAGKNDTDIPGGIADINDGPGKILERKEFEKNLSRFSTSLPRGEREVFMLRFIDQAGIREIADTLNKNESTVKTHLYRTIKKFRDDETLKSLTEGERR